MQLSDVAGQTSPWKELQPQNSGACTDHFQQTGNGPVPFLNSSNSFSTDIQETDKHVITNLNKDNNFFPLTITTPHIEERLVRHEQIIELYLQLSSTVVLKRKKKNCCMCLWISKMDALVDSEG